MRQSRPLGSVRGGVQQCPRLLGHVISVTLVRIFPLPAGLRADMRPFPIRLPAPHHFVFDLRADIDSDFVADVFVWVVRVTNNPGRQACGQFSLARGGIVAVSEDLRIRLARKVASGMSRRQAAALFEVSASSAVRDGGRYEDEGTVAVKPRPSRQRRLDP